MQLFRIAVTQFASQTDGEGARLYGGRWNQIGDPVLYMTEDISLAILGEIQSRIQRVRPKAPVKAGMDRAVKVRYMVKASDQP